jgi:colanic acid/amylovoran biosynthesis glycosyltransferase
MAVSLRGYDIHVYPLKHPGCYGRLWDKVTKVHSISRHLLERAWESGLPEAIPNQIITPAVRTPLPAKENFEFQMPLNLLTVARLTWIKGLNYALQAVALLKAQGLDIHYTIIGEGPEREHLLHEIHELRLTNQVTLAGKLSHSEALTSMRNADIYLQPSLNEGFCNAVLEAQAMGCLCVVSDVGALPENILHNYTGWLVTPKKPEEVVNKINYVFNLPVKEREFISYNARKRVTEKFAMEQHVSHWSLFYQ